MSTEREERVLSLANNPAEDIAWCTARGYRAYLVGVGGLGVSFGVAIARDTQLVGIAAMGDTLVWDGALISIRTPS